jgi:hypothetical protein
MIKKSMSRQADSMLSISSQEIYSIFNIQMRFIMAIMDITQADKTLKKRVQTHSRKMNALEHAKKTNF